MTDSAAAIGTPINEILENFALLDRWTTAIATSSSWDAGFGALPAGAHSDANKVQGAPARSGWRPKFTERLGGLSCISRR